MPSDDRQATVSTLLNTYSSYVKQNNFPLNLLVPESRVLCRREANKLQ